MKAIKYILFWFILTRLLMTATGVFARYITAGKINTQYIFADHPNVALDIWSSWDSLWYKSICANGYSTKLYLEPIAPDRHNYAFFPLYPGLTKLVGFGVGGDYVLAGVVLSNICLLAAAYFLYKLTAKLFSDDVGLRAVKFLMLCPFSMVLSGFFAESLFLLLLILIFYFVDKSEYAKAILIGLLLGLSKVNGIAALPSLAIMGERSKKSVAVKFLPAIAVVVGILSFAFFVYKLTGDIFGLFTIQSAWHRKLTIPFEILYRSLSYGGPITVFTAFSTLITFLYIFKLLFMLPFEYFVLAFFMLMLPLSSGILSMTRFIASIFPLYMGLGIHSKSKNTNILLTCLFFVLQLFIMFYWSLGVGLVI